MPSGTAITAARLVRPCQIQGAPLRARISASAASTAKTAPAPRARRRKSSCNSPVVSSVR